MAIAQLTEEKARLSEEIVLLTTTLKETVNSIQTTFPFFIVERRIVCKTGRIGEIR